jgi:hypothetical protein
MPSACCVKATIYQAAPILLDLALRPHVHMARRRVLIPSTLGTLAARQMLNSAMLETLSRSADLGKQ